jgi:glycosyltransferase involved in cell wall biosynthesis
VKRLFETELAGYDHEHIFCDNASTDGTVPVLKEIALADPHVKIIANSRNFGPFRSTFNGILSCSGDAVLCLLPADLQDPPEVIPKMVRLWEDGYQVVYGVRKTREENVLMTAVRRMYYRLVARLADIHIPLHAGEFQLIDRVVLDALRKFDDYYPYIRGMIASCGFKSMGVEYAWQARKRGFSKNRLYHMVDQALNGLVSFTNVPLRLCMFFGFLVAALSFLFGLVALTVNLVYYRQFAPPGIPTLIVAIFFFSGLQLFFFGVLGEYIGAVHFQVRKRPLVIERERINFARPAGPSGMSPGAGGR